MHNHCVGHLSYLHRQISFHQANLLFEAMVHLSHILLQRSTQIVP